MKAVDFRQLSKQDLMAKVVALEENYFRLRCNKTIGQLEDSSVITKSRREIARAKTILTEKIKEESKDK